MKEGSLAAPFLLHHFVGQLQPLQAQQRHSSQPHSGPQAQQAQPRVFSSMVVISSLLE